MPVVVRRQELELTGHEASGSRTQSLSIEQAIEAILADLKLVTENGTGTRTGQFDIWIIRDSHRQIVRYSGPPRVASQLAEFAMWFRRAARDDNRILRATASKAELAILERCGHQRGALILAAGSLKYGGALIQQLMELSEEDFYFLVACEMEKEYSGAQLLSSIK